MVTHNAGQVSMSFLSWPAPFSSQQICVFNGQRQCRIISIATHQLQCFEFHIEKSITVQNQTYTKQKSNKEQQQQKYCTLHLTTCPAN